MIVVHTLMGLRALDAKTGAIRWTASLPMARSGAVPHQVKLYPSLAKTDRIYVSYDERLMAYRLADGQPLWSNPATVDSGRYFGDAVPADDAGDTRRLSPVRM